MLGPGPRPILSGHPRANTVLGLGAAGAASWLIFVGAVLATSGG